MSHCGIRPAKPSLESGLLPAGIHQHLRKVYEIPELSSVTSEYGFRTPPLGQIAREMASDLTLGNRGNEPWGWTDPEALFFLDDWRALNPDSVFVLVYDSPITALINMGNDDSDPNMQLRLDNWAAYNGAMLRYYFRNMDRCILVHSKRIESDADSSPDEIKRRIRESIEAKGGKPLSDPSESPEDTPFGIRDQPGENPTAHPLEEFSLDRFPNQRAIYDELQSVASLPLEAESCTSETNEGVWESWAADRDRIATGDDMAHHRHLHGQKPSDLLNNELGFVRYRYSLAREELDDARIRCRLVEAGLSRTDGALRQAKQEATALGVENERLQDELAKPPPRTGAKEVVKQHLSYRLGSIMVNDARSPVALPLIPVSLLLEALRFQRQKRKGLVIPKLEEYADADSALQVKKQLSYRLGNVVVRRSKSPLGWLVLPFAIFRQIQTFNRKRSQTS